MHSFSTGQNRAKLNWEAGNQNILSLSVELRTISQEIWIFKFVVYLFFLVKSNHLYIKDHLIIFGYLKSLSLRKRSTTQISIAIIWRIYNSYYSARASKYRTEMTIIFLKAWAYSSYLVCLLIGGWFLKLLS